MAPYFIFKVANMKYNRRQFTRMNIRRDATLDFGKNKYEYSIINFSLGGVFVQGCFKQQLDDTCTMKLNMSDTYPKIEIDANCSVIRIADNGLALKFTSMEPDSFLFLQETLLYEANSHWCREPTASRTPLFQWKTT